jgi:succinoglycan biosynthesis transport protein ExoP
MEDSRVHALDYVSAVRRRKWWLVVPIVTSVFVGLALVRFLPKEYRSTTTLGVAASIVSPNLVNQTTPLDNQERMRALSQQLVSLPILARVVREERLGSGAPNDPQIRNVRRAIEISVPEPVATTNEVRRLDTFIVSYSDEDPARAQRIANRLATVFVDENSKLRAERAEDTSAFIATQFRASQARLADLEARLRKSKEAYMGRLPEQTSANLQTLSGLRQQLEANATALRGEQDRLSMIERQLEGLKQGSGEVVFIPRSGEAAQPPEQRVFALQRDLATARAMYTDKHPEVQRLEDELASARKDVVANRDRPAEDRLSQLQADPTYRQLIADREMARLRIRELQRAGTDGQRQIGEYQARVEAAPMVEQQLATVQRDYDLEKTQYSNLSAKLQASTIAENVERNRSGEQFTILYPASYPSEPTKPVPWRVMLIAIAGGLCLGGALSLGREYLDRSVHDVRDLKGEFEIPVLGEVTRIQPA